MKDLSLHILDIVENSIRAGAKEVEIRIKKDLKKDWLEIDIRDNGQGMDKSTAEKATDPFFTTKSIRKVGLGLSLFEDAARMAGGNLVITSESGHGTRVKATFQLSHIDCKPLGDISKTLTTLIIANPEVRFQYYHWENGQEYQLDSKNLTRGSAEQPDTITKQIHFIRRDLQSIQHKHLGD